MAKRGSAEWRIAVRIGQTRARAEGRGLQFRDPSKTVQRTCPYCGVPFTIYKTRPRVSCGKVECKHRARSAAATRTLHRAYAAGRISRARPPALRRKIALGVRRAYAQGRLIPPSTRPEVAAKISLTKRRRPTVLSPRIRKRIGAKIRALWKQGRFRRAHGVDARRKRSEALRGRTLPRHVRTKIGQTLKRLWAAGKLRPTPRPDGPPAPERRLRKLLEPLGFQYQMKHFVANRKRYAPGQRGFRGRQYYCPDFTHPILKMCVEVDGRSHREFIRIRRTDARQDAFLRSKGFLVVRVTNEAVMTTASTVLQQIMGAITQ